MTDLLPYIQVFLLSMIVVGMAVNTFSNDTTSESALDTFMALIFLLILWAFLTALFLGLVYLPYYIMTGGWATIAEILN